MIIPDYSLENNLSLLSLRNQEIAFNSIQRQWLFSNEG
jgi:hypothetical protein